MVTCLYNNKRGIDMKDTSIIDIFKAAFNVEVANKVEIVDNKLVVYINENKKVLVEINKIATL